MKKYFIYSVCALLSAACISSCSKEAEDELVSDDVYTLSAFTTSLEGDSENELRTTQKSSGKFIKNDWSASDIVRVYGFSQKNGGKYTSSYKDFNLNADGSFTGDGSLTASNFIAIYNLSNCYPSFDGSTYTCDFTFPANQTYNDGLEGTIPMIGGGLESSQGEVSKDIMPKFYFNNLAGIVKFYFSKDAQINNITVTAKSENNNSCSLTYDGKNIKNYALKAKKTNKTFTTTLTIKNLSTAEDGRKYCLVALPPISASNPITFTFSNGQTRTYSKGIERLDYKSFDLSSAF